MVELILDQLKGLLIMNGYIYRCASQRTLMERRMVKVLKALAEYLDVSFGDLLEAVVLHAFENKLPFSPITLGQIKQLKEIHRMDYGLQVGHRLVDQESSLPPIRRL